ncbi:MAG: hypothetical protein CMN26_02230 [Salinisphaera sp.]|nr:hypothetical protein [Salinisphaera sp.]
MILLAGASLVTRLWSESIKTASVLFGLLFVLSSVLYLVQHHTQTFERYGIIAAKAPVARDFQQDLGLMNKTLSNIDRKVAKLKKETSENPRKELANRGVEWSADSYYEALQNKDTETALLFIEGGQALKYSGMLRALLTSNDEIASAYLAHPVAPIKLSCMTLTRISAEELSSFTRAQKQAVKVGCARYPSVIKKYHENLASAEERYDEANKKYLDLKNGVKTAGSCRKLLMENDAQALIREAEKYYPYSDSNIDDYDRLLIAIQGDPMAGISRNPDIEGLVAEYCKSKTDLTYATPPDDTWIQKYRMLIKYLQ